MRLKTDEALKKFKRPAGSIVLYVGAIVVALIGIAYLATNIVLFQKTVAQYVAQGYPAATVAGQLLPSQLLPGIYEPVAVYGGIALILVGIGMINQKVWNGLRMMSSLDLGAAIPATDEMDGMVSEAEGLGPEGFKSDESGASEFGTGRAAEDEAKDAESQMDEQNSGKPA